MVKVGIFGGAFNPVHCGHVSIATQASDVLKLKKMLIVPTMQPPHKDDSGLLDYDTRAEMCRLAFDSRIQSGQFEVCNVERRLGGTSYTINTVRQLKKEYPSGTEFYLIIGGDMLFYFEKWYRYEALLGECRVTAAAREENEYADMCEFAARVGRIKVLNLRVVRASSTEVRERLKTGESITGLVPPKVERYITENGLYV